MKYHFGLYFVPDLILHLNFITIIDPKSMQISACWTDLTIVVVLLLSCMQL